MRTPTAVWIVRESARPLAQRLAEELGASLFPTLPDHESSATSNREMFEKVFAQYQGWVLIMAAGIATRFLCGLPSNKHTDPAVVMLDEASRFAVPLLGGHEGGANALAYQIAEITGATPVITTATEALKPLTLGIGCRKGMHAERIHRAVEHSLQLSGSLLKDVREVATVDVKAREPGLLEWVKTHQLPLRIFSSSQLSQRPITATPSDWVRRNIGLAGVCEPCALLASPRGQLILPKYALAGVTVAIVSDLAPHVTTSCTVN